MIQDDADVPLEQPCKWNKSVQQGRWFHSNLMTQTWFCQTSKPPEAPRFSYLPNDSFLPRVGLLSEGLLHLLPYKFQGHQELGLFGNMC